MRSERDPEYLLEIGRINADARLSEKEKKSLIELAGFETLEEIEESLGLLTDEEKALLKQPGLHDDPTPEELALLGPDFVERVQERVRLKIQTTEQSTRYQKNHPPTNEQ